MSDLDTFRADTRAWLEANCPPEMRQPLRSEADACWGGRNWSFQSGAQKQWLEVMADRGWTVPDWPVAYGGGGLSTDETRVLKQEMQRIGARPPLTSFGISMLGPALLKFGTEEQKKHYLGQIARGEIRWCQGYSEPGAGSDLAGLQTKAEDQGDHWLVNGQKVWTSYADQADWIFCLVRTSTEAKQGGISFLLFDMQTPGVSTKPILLISGSSPFCETFFDDVRVPKSQIVGDVNRGWDVAKYLLGHEREMISGMGLGSGGSLGAATRPVDPMLRAEIAAFDIDALAFAAMSERFAAQWKAGEAHPASPSMMKYAGTELNKRRNELAMAAGGSDALEWGSQRSRAGRTPRDWLRSKGNSIEGGTSEIQLNIVAKHILRLPGGVKMALLNDDQKMLQETAAGFLADEGGIAKQLRHWRAIGCKDGFGHGLWKQFAELGLTGICIPEDQGGLGLGATEAALVLEEIGKNLTPSPFLTTAVAAVRAIEGTAHAERWYPGTLSGDAVLALAIDERARHDPSRTALEAKRQGNGFTLSGAKQFVVHGGSADMIVTAARTAGSPGESNGITLFAIPRDAAGLAVDNLALVDSSKAARLIFDDVEVDADAVIGEVDGGWQPLSRALNAGRAGAAAELVGVAAGASAMTLDYLKQRKQFGRLIGEFQALQHRAAHLYSEIEIARAAAFKAARLIDDDDDQAELFTAVAKAKAADTANLAVREGVQMHGGIGMTDEHDVGLFMKREAVLGELFGDVYFHRGRVAELSGY